MDSLNGGGRTRRTTVVGLATLTSALLLVGILSNPAPAYAAAYTTTVNMGVASTFSVLAAGAVSGSGFASGDVGTTSTTPIPDAIDGPGARYVNTAEAAAAQSAVTTAYNDVLGRTATAAITGTELSGRTFTSGVYSAGGALNLSAPGPLTLDAEGDPNAVFIFQVNGALTNVAATHVVLANGAQASNVFWQVVGAAAMGGGTFAGTIMAVGAVTLAAGMTLNGRALSLDGAVGLSAATINTSPLALAITSPASMANTTPTISGTTNANNQSTVTVTIDGQTLSSQVVEGAWSVTASPAVPAGATYPVVAWVSDPVSRNTGTTSQSLTVLPAVTVPGAPTSVVAVAGNASATLSWTAPADNGSAITGYTVTSVPAGGTVAMATSTSTSATVTTLTNGTAYTFTVTATNSVGTSPAAPSNSVTPSTVPGAPTAVVAVAGNASAAVSWTAPSSNGGSAITGYTVTSSPGGLTSTVGAGSTSTTVSGLTNGTAYTFTVTATNSVGTSPAGTSKSVTPAAPAPPTVTIDGGATAVTNYTTRTIAGTSNAASGTTMTVTGIGPVMTTTVLLGAWRVKQTTAVASGPYTVLASVTDSAGTGTATQELTVVTPTNTTPAQTVAPGGTVVVAGEGFTAGETVEVWLESIPVQLGTLTVNAQGGLSGSFTIPIDTTDGIHHIVLIDSAGVRYASAAAITVTALSATFLSSTGADITPGWFALAFLLLGGFMLAFRGRARRRKELKSR